MKNKSNGVVLVVIATLIGLYIRLGSALSAPFPLNDGGLFYAMMRDLQANGYHLPVFSTYNGGQIPFAYPPLGFYLTSLLADLLRVDLLDVTRWLPPFISALTIPAFYLLASRLVRSETVAALAALLFALAPRAFNWQIMGGGVTRSPGFLFEILALACVAQLFTKPSRRIIAWTIVWSSLVVVTHPEATSQTVFAAFLLYLFFDRSRKGLLRALIIAAFTIGITSPWWATILTRHGFEPFLAANAAVSARSFPWIARFVALFRFDFMSEPSLKIISTLGLLGIFLRLNKRDFFLPVWLTTTFLLEPRSAPQIMTIPMSLLAAHALTEMILQKFSASDSDSLDDLLKSAAARAFLGLLLILLTLDSYLVAEKIAHEFSLARSNMDAYEWIPANTPTGSTFAIVTGELPLRDPFSEWLPALTERVTVTPTFGYEWVADPPFTLRMEAYQSLQECLYQDTTCLQDWSVTNQSPFDYLIIRSYRNGVSFLSPLQIYLSQSAEFNVVYQKPEIIIYQAQAP